MGDRGEKSMAEVWVWVDESNWMMKLGLGLEVGVEEERRREVKLMKLKRPKLDLVSPRGGYTRLFSFALLFNCFYVETGRKDLFVQ